MVENTWFTIRQLCERWQKSPDAIERLLKSRALRGLKIGGSWRVHQSAIAEFEADGISPRERPMEKFRTSPDRLSAKVKRFAALYGQ